MVYAEEYSEQVKIWRGVRLWDTLHATQRSRLGVSALWKLEVCFLKGGKYISLIIQNNLSGTRLPAKHVQMWAALTDVQCAGGRRRSFLALLLEQIWTITISSGCHILKKEVVQRVHAQR